MARFYRSYNRVAMVASFAQNNTLLETVGTVIDPDDKRVAYTVGVWQYMDKEPRVAINKTFEGKHADLGRFPASIVQDLAVLLFNAAVVVKRHVAAWQAKQATITPPTTPLDPAALAALAKAAGMGSKAAVEVLAKEAPKAKAAKATKKPVAKKTGKWSAK